jgi:hypothetical protein
MFGVICSSESPFSNVEIGEPVTALDAERLAHGKCVALFSDVRCHILKSGV